MRDCIRFPTRRVIAFVGEQHEFVALIRLRRFRPPGVVRRTTHKFQTRPAKEIRFPRGTCGGFIGLAHCGFTQLSGSGTNAISPFALVSRHPH